VTLFKVSEFEETTCLFFSSRCTFCRSANRSWHGFVFANNKLIGSLIPKMCVLPSLSLSCSLARTSWLIFSGFYTHTHSFPQTVCGLSSGFQYALESSPPDFFSGKNKTKTKKHFKCIRLNTKKCMCCLLTRDF